MQMNFHSRQAEVTHRSRRVTADAVRALSREPGVPFERKCSKHGSGIAPWRRERCEAVVGFMSYNTFGHLFRVTTFGESHGPAIGCVVDGAPPRIALNEADIQPYLDKRRPGQSRYTTQRQEPDTVKILSGVFVDEATGVQVTTGTPIGLLIENVDQRSKDYSDIKDKYRPGHADYTYDAKYGLRDYRGGGAPSGGRAGARRAAGAIARKIVPGMTVRGALIQMGEHKIEP